ncbi:GAF domain-containing protein [Paucibacter sp. TC2R-5]|uniref:ATP-binding protein n=1 Tax=Paucibacter sp. TC2R-5 TaxID=2893555 RepID=UPI0021E4BE12|nr:ATP-binding protein [Paucibacter sp. TC2R-5]MCV2358897.1 GAF domain-containing protein [Paucibacter sp. TC2R-5]
MASAVPMLEFYAADEAVAQMEATLQAASGAERLRALIELAWHLRERDSARALELCGDAEQVLASGVWPDAVLRSGHARLLLIRGEISYQQIEMEDAVRAAQQALAEFEAIGDAIGRADAHSLRALIARGQGDGPRRDAEHLAMAAAAAGLDPLRLELAELVLIVDLIFRDVVWAKQRWAQHCQGGAPDYPPLAIAAARELEGLLAGFLSDYGQAIVKLIDGYALALTGGQTLRAVRCALNCGVWFRELNDFEAGLEWSQRALSLARRCGLRAAIGQALAHTGDVLLCMNRHQSAREMLQEGLQMLAGQAESRIYAMALKNLAMVDLASGQFELALEALRRVAQKAIALDSPDLLCHARALQARALLAAGAQAQEAISAATLALEGAPVGSTYRIVALQVMAEVVSSQPQQLQQAVTAHSPALHFLHLALDSATASEGYTVPADLLAGLASEYAKAGDHARAYDFSLQAAEALEKTHNQNASKRAIAMQVQHQTERAQAEGEKQRLLALAHAERAASLEQANSTLEQLGAIGRDITGNLNATAIFAALDTHVHALLDAFSFLIYRLGADGETVTMLFGIEDCVPIPPFTYTLTPDGPGRRCIAERREVVVETQAGQSATVPGTVECLSMMFAPLMAGERVLGLMNIASPRPQAYGEREVAIFRTLCAYGAIALANAEAQAQLIQSEKLASLGQLVANVAHEINTPIGAIKSSGATMVESLSDTLAALPPLLQMLDASSQALFGDLIEQASRTSPLLSSREERAVVKGLTAALEQAGLADARALAAMLGQMGLTTVPEALLPLLRHPLRERILQAVQGASTVVRSASNINTAVERVAKIVFALKSFSRVDNSGELRPTDLVESIETVLTIYQHQLQQGCGLIRRYEPDLPLLPCLPDELNQVWTNLIHNALQAMQHRGVLTISIGREDEALVVSVGDTGCGIPEAIRSRIFEPFFTTKPAGEGSGLGLDIVKKIVEKHRGRIEVQSEAGVGTRFSVILPLA